MTGNQTRLLTDNIFNLEINRHGQAVETVRITLVPNHITTPQDLASNEIALTQSAHTLSELDLQFDELIEQLNCLRSRCQDLFDTTADGL